MSEAQRLRESAAMVQRLADQQTTPELRAHLTQTARGFLRMAQKAEEADRFSEDAPPIASISSQAA